MSIKNVKMFFERVSANEKLGKKLEKVNNELQGINTNVKNYKHIINTKIIPIAKDVGFDFTAKDFLDYVSKVSSGLSEEDLLNVSGGFSANKSMAALGILLTFAPFAPNFAAIAKDTYPAPSKQPRTSIVQTINKKSSNHHKNFKPSKIMSFMPTIFGGKSTEEQEKDNLVNYLKENNITSIAQVPEQDLEWFDEALQSVGEHLVENTINGTYYLKGTIPDENQTNELNRIHKMYVAQGNKTEKEGAKNDTVTETKSDASSDADAKTNSSEEKSNESNGTLNVDAETNNANTALNEAKTDSSDELETSSSSSSLAVENKNNETLDITANVNIDHVSVANSDISSANVASAAASSPNEVTAASANPEPLSTNIDTAPAPMPSLEVSSTSTNEAGPVGPATNLATSSANENMAGQAQVVAPARNAATAKAITSPVHYEAVDHNLPIKDQLSHMCNTLEKINSFDDLDNSRRFFVVDFSNIIKATYNAQNDTFNFANEEMTTKINEFCFKNGIRPKVGYIVNSDENLSPVQILDRLAKTIERANNLITNISNKQNFIEDIKKIVCAKNYDSEYGNFELPSNASRQDHENLNLVINFYQNNINDDDMRVTYWGRNSNLPDEKNIDNLTITGNSINSSDELNNTGGTQSSLNFFNALNHYAGSITYDPSLKTFVFNNL